MRRVLGSDEPLMQALFERNGDEETTRYFHPFPLTPQAATAIASHDGRDRYYVAATDEALAGLSMLRGWDEGYDVPSFGILVDREWRGRGVGAALLDFTLHQARELGATRVRLSVYASHTAAIALYRSRGFREASRAKAPIARGEDDVLVMVAELSEH
jgi:[ribosomal protein S18]-alanine N-acetyltransferase